MGSSSSRSSGSSFQHQQNPPSSQTPAPAKPLAKMPTVKRKEDSEVTSYNNFAAIDFGTTYCSLAFKTAGDSGITVMRLDGTDRRVPNSLLLNVIEVDSVCTMCNLKECKNQEKCTADYAEQERQTAPRRSPKNFKYKVNSFGHLAQRNYQTLRKNKYESHIYFERVKLAVMQKEVCNTSSIYKNDFIEIKRM